MTPGSVQATANAAVGPSLSVSVGEDSGARLAFSGRGRLGNVSLRVGGGDPLGARARLAALVGRRAEDMVFMEQVHGGRVARVGRADRGRGLRDPADAVPGADALVTEDDGVALVVLVADCVPVLLVDPGRAVGAVHVGRRGVQAGVVGAAVAALAGDDTSAVVAVLGPAIGGCCYELPGDLVEAVAADLPEARATTAWGAPALDLPAAVSAQLSAAGVGRIRMVGDCTRCNADRWFSHRAHAGEGRQAGLVARTLS